MVFLSTKIAKPRLSKEILPIPINHLLRSRELALVSIDRWLGIQSGAN
jgi:hypothetical protein